MKKLLTILGIATLLFTTGCTPRVPMESEKTMIQTKKFQTPSEGKAGLYVYREKAFVGSALRKAIRIDGKEIGSLTSGTFLHKELPLGKYKISTYSEFGLNHLDISMTEAKNYFVKQELKPGVFFGGAKLIGVSEEQGKKDIPSLRMIKTLW